MKSIQQRVKHFYLEDKWQFLGLGIACIFFSILGIVTQKIYEVPFFWLFPPAAVLFFYQFILFSRTELHAKPVPVYVKHALKRVRAKRITQMLLAILFVTVNLYVFIKDELLSTEWNVTSFIGLGAFIALAGLLTWVIYWYQRRFHTGSLRDLERDLIQLKSEMKKE